MSLPLPFLQPEVPMLSIADVLTRYAGFVTAGDVDGGLTRLRTFFDLTGAWPLAVA